MSYKHEVFLFSSSHFLLVMNQENLAVKILFHLEYFFLYWNNEMVLYKLIRLLKKYI